TQNLARNQNLVQSLLQNLMQKPIQNLPPLKNPPQSNLQNKQCNNDNAKPTKNSVLSFSKTTTKSYLEMIAYLLKYFAPIKNATASITTTINISSFTPILFPTFYDFALLDFA
ncbi:hypothetical protein, partial [Helicobacter sp. T3_23-1056]